MADKKYGDIQYYSKDQKHLDSRIQQKAWKENKYLYNKATGKRFYGSGERVKYSNDGRPEYDPNGNMRKNTKAVSENGKIKIIKF